MTIIEPITTHAPLKTSNTSRKSPEEEPNRQSPKTAESKPQPGSQKPSDDPNVESPKTYGNKPEIRDPKKPHQPDEYEVESQK